MKLVQNKKHEQSAWIVAVCMALAGLILAAATVRGGEVDRKQFERAYTQVFSSLPPVVSPVAPIPRMIAFASYDCCVWAIAIFVPEKNDRAKKRIDNAPLVAFAEVAVIAAIRDKKSRKEIYDKILGLDSCKHEHCDQYERESTMRAWAEKANDGTLKKWIEKLIEERGKSLRRQAYFREQDVQQMLSGSKK